MVWQIHLCGLIIPTKYSYKLYNHCQAYLQLHQYWTSCWKACICPCWCVWLYVWLHLSAYWHRRAAHGAGYNHDCCSHPETYTYTNTLQYNFCTNLEWAYNRQKRLHQSVGRSKARLLYWEGTQKSHFNQPIVITTLLKVIPLIWIAKESSNIKKVMIAPLWERLQLFKSSLQL